MDYHCAKFGDFIVSAVVFIVRTDRQTDADQRCSHATIVDVSSDKTTVVEHVRVLQSETIDKCEGGNTVEHYHSRSKV